MEESRNSRWMSLPADIRSFVEFMSIQWRNNCPNGIDRLPVCPKHVSEVTIAMLHVIQYEHERVSLPTVDTLSKSLRDASQITAAARGGTPSLPLFRTAMNYLDTAHQRETEKRVEDERQRKFRQRSD